MDRVPTAPRPAGYVQLKQRRQPVYCVDQILAELLLTKIAKIADKNQPSPVLPHPTEEQQHCVINLAFEGD